MASCLLLLCCVFVIHLSLSLVWLFSDQAIPQSVESAVVVHAEICPQYNFHLLNHLVYLHLISHFFKFSNHFYILIIISKAMISIKKKLSGNVPSYFTSLLPINLHISFIKVNDSYLLPKSNITKNTIPCENSVSIFNNHQYIRRPV